MELRILGTLEARAGGADVTPTSGKQRALLALLALHAGEVMPSDRLVEALWGADAPGSTRNALQVHVSQLRRSLGAGGEKLVTRPGGYVLDIQDEDIDARRFEGLIARGRRELESGSPETAARRFRAALELWRGDPLGDLRYETFARTEAARLDEFRLIALESRIEADLRLGRHFECIGELEVLVEEEPLRERPRAQLMLALYRSGRQADALDAYRSARAALVDELGIEPGPDLRELHGRILAQDPQLMGSTTGRPSAPEPFGNSPVPVTSFVGREREVAELTEVIPRQRLVSLKGPGGAGKTRLALRVAQELAAEFEHGVRLVELAVAHDPADVWPTVCAALDGAAESGRSYAETAVATLSSQQVLLVLDNCEQILGPVREVADVLLSGCPRLRILATTREALGHAAEHVWPIPDMGEHAVTLFAERAERALPGRGLDESEIAVAERICRRLDGLPLAIELAAARVSVLSLEQIDERLADRFRLLRSPSPGPDRHRSLRAAVDWSYDLLDEREQIALAAMAVFRGGFEIDAAEHVVAGGAIAEQDVLDLLAQLVEKSLVARYQERGPAARYGLHETIREYAAERLDELDLITEVRGRHAEHFLAVAEQAERRLSEPSVEWLDRLERNHDNLRAALDHLEGSDGDGLVRLAGALAGFWEYGGYLSEGTRRLATALEADAGRRGYRAKALSGASALAALSGDPTTAGKWAEEALALYREVGDPHGVAEALWRLGYAVAEQGEPAAAQPFLEESLRAFDDLREEGMAISVARSLAWTHYLLGDLVEARVLHEENLERSRAGGDERMEARSLGSLATLAVDDDRAAEALPLLRRAYLIDRSLGDRLEAALDLCRLAKALVALGEPATAARLLGSFEAIAKESGADVPWVSRMNEGTLASIRDQLGDPATHESLEAGRVLTPDDTAALASASLRGRDLPG